MIDVFNYRDYRRFLRDAYEEKRKIDPKFSYGYIGSKLGTARQFFAKVIAGERPLPSRHIDKVSALFALSKRQSEYFRLLVLFAHAKTLDERSHWYEEIISYPGVKVKPLEREYHEFYDKWYGDR